MKKEKQAGIAQSHKPFVTPVVAILLATIGVLEFTAFRAWNSSAVSNLPFPVGLILGSVIFVACVGGIVGLWMRREIGLYFALVVSVFEVVLGSLALRDAVLRSSIPLVAAIEICILTLFGLATGIGVLTTELNREGRPSAPPRTTLPAKAPASVHEYAVEVENVTKHYHLGPVIVPAVNRLSLKVRRGEFIAIMGSSGSGKSTLLNLIGALDKPSSGRVLIDGVDLSLLSDTGLAKLRNEKIGFIFQSYNLIARSSVLRNMELPAMVKGYSKEDRLQRVNSLLTIVGLGDKAPRKPKTLSGGEQQRVAIARALINDPKILLADEPTGNIDSRTGKEIMGFLRTMNEEKQATVIMVTHDREVAEIADQIIHLRDGKIMEREVLRSFST